MICSVHDADVFHRGRELTNITPEEDCLASLDCPDDGGFEFITRRVDVWKTNQFARILEGASLTKNRTAAPDVTKLVDSIKLIVGISGIVDEREAFRRLMNVVSATSRKDKENRPTEYLVVNAR